MTPCLSEHATRAGKNWRCMRLYFGRHYKKKKKKWSRVCTSEEILKGNLKSLCSSFHKKMSKKVTFPRLGTINEHCTLM